MKFYGFVLHFAPLNFLIFALFSPTIVSRKIIEFTASIREFHPPILWNLLIWISSWFWSALNWSWIWFSLKFLRNGDFNYQVLVLLVKSLRIKLPSYPVNNSETNSENRMWKKIKSLHFCRVLEELASWYQIQSV